MNLAKGEQTRKEVLQAAKQLFLTQGYGSTSMRDIAKAAGNLSVGSLYNHFSGKEAIFETLLMELSPHPMMLALAETVGGETVTQFVRNFLPRVIPLLFEHLEFVELAQIDIREFGGRNVSTLIEKYIPAFVLLMGKLQGAKGVRIAHPFVLLRLIVSTILGYVITHKLAPRMVIQEMTEEAWLNQLIEFVLHGIAVTEADTA